MGFLFVFRSVRGNNGNRAVVCRVGEIDIVSPSVVAQEMFAEVVCLIIKPVEDIEVEDEDVKTRKLSYERTNHCPRRSLHHTSMLDGEWYVVMQNHKVRFIIFAVWPPAGS